MYAARVVIGNYCCRKNTKQILDTCGWSILDNTISHATINLLHSILTTKKPNYIYNMFIHSNRTCKEIVPKYTPISEYG